MIRLVVDNTVGGGRPGRPTIESELRAALTAPLPALNSRMARYVFALHINPKNKALRDLCTAVDSIARARYGAAWDMMIGRHGGTA